MCYMRCERWIDWNETDRLDRVDAALYRYFCYYYCCCCCPLDRSTFCLSRYALSSGLWPLTSRTQSRTWSRGMAGEEWFCWSDPLKVDLLLLMVLKKDLVSNMGNVTINFLQDRSCQTINNNVYCSFLFPQFLENESAILIIHRNAAQRNLNRVGLVNLHRQPVKALFRQRERRLLLVSTL